MSARPRAWHCTGLEIPVFTVNTGVEIRVKTAATKKWAANRLSLLSHLGALELSPTPTTDTPRDVPRGHPPGTRKEGPTK